MTISASLRIARSIDPSEDRAASDPSENRFSRTAYVSTLRIVSPFSKRGRNCRNCIKPFSRGDHDKSVGVLLFLLVVLGVESIPVQVGQIWVAAPVNATILLDGRAAGVVVPRVSGLMITNVPAGRHTVTVRAGKGTGVISRIIDVRALETYELVVPALSLYQRSRLQSDAGELRVTSVSRRCKVTIAGSRHEMTSKTLTIKSLSPGSYDLAAVCGRTEMTGRVEIKAGRTTLVEVDARGPIVRVVGEQSSRPRHVAAPSASEGVVAATIPGHWKRAIATVFDSAIYEFSIQNVAGLSVTATFRCSSSQTASVLTERLYSQPEVEDVSVSSIEDVSGGVLVRVTITFVQP